MKQWSEIASLLTDLWVSGKSVSDNLLSKINRTWMNVLTYGIKKKWFTICRKIKLDPYWKIYTRTFVRIVNIHAVLSIY